MLLSGMPASLEDVCNPDRVSIRNLCYISTAPTRHRYERSQRRAGLMDCGSEKICEAPLEAKQQITDHNHTYENVYCCDKECMYTFCLLIIMNYDFQITSEASEAQQQTIDYGFDEGYIDFCFLILMDCAFQDL